MLHNLKTISILKNLAPNNRKNFVPISMMLQQLHKRPNVMVIQLGKTPTVMFDQSFWAGHKPIGLSVWLSSVLPHLPFNKFYLYVDQNNQDSMDYIDYHNNFFDRLFYKNYLGFSIGNKANIASSYLHKVSKLSAEDLPKKINSKTNTAIIDVRRKDELEKFPLQNLPLNRKNFKYINIPINDQDLGETFYYKTQEMQGKWNIITMCARGYRNIFVSRIGLYKHVKVLTWKQIKLLKICEVH